MNKRTKLLIGYDGSENADAAVETSSGPVCPETRRRSSLRWPMSGSIRHRQIRTSLRPLVLGTAKFFGGQTRCGRALRSR